MTLSASAKMLEKDTLSQNKIVCACGCGTIIDRYNKSGRERKFKNGHNGRIREIRVCSRCGSERTFIRKSGIKVWYRDEFRNLLCANCYNWTVRGDYHRLKLKHRIKYKGKYIQLDHDPRIGICNWCRAVKPFDTKYTQLHHDDRYYNDSNPLENTIELCISCHTREKYRLGEMGTVKIMNYRNRRAEIERG